MALRKSGYFFNTLTPLLSLTIGGPKVTVRPKW